MMFMRSKSIGENEKKGKVFLADEDEDDENTISDVRIEDDGNEDDTVRSANPKSLEKSFASVEQS